MARIVLPHYPHHIVQRGHNRQVIFDGRQDYQRYLDTLREFKEKYGVAVYAFCLMTNHVHLLLSPGEPTGIGKLMKRLAGRQTRHHNRLEGRSGTLWEGRYKSSLVERDPTCSPVAATSSSIRSVPGWWQSRRTTPGRAAATVSGRTPAIGSTPIRVTSLWEKTRPNAIDAIAISCSPESRAGSGS
jgi:REP element-mobilizing transposase RayT